MKKILILIILALNLIPKIKDGQINFEGYNFCYAEDKVALLVTYMTSLGDGNNYERQGNYVKYSDLATGQPLGLIYPTPEFIAANPNFRAFLNIERAKEELKPYGPDGQVCTSCPVHSDGNGGDEYGEEEDPHLREFMDGVSQRALDFINAYMSTHTGFGTESTGEEPPCYKDLTIEFEEVVGDNDKVANNSGAIASLPCANNFMLDNKKIVEFSLEQVGLIGNYHFDGGVLQYVTSNVSNIKYSHAIGFTLLKCFTQDCEGVIIDNRLVKLEPYYTYKFIAFDKVITDAVNIGAKYYQDIGVFKGIPYGNNNYCFDVTATARKAQPGDVVVAISKDNPPVLYCYTLKAEDCEFSLKSGRDNDLNYDGLDLKHPINMPKWARDFFRMFEPEKMPCIRGRINLWLSRLHSTDAYKYANNKALQIEMEYEVLGYSAVLGALYCYTDESVAQGKSCFEQYCLGFLNELIRTVDIPELVYTVTEMATNSISPQSNHKTSFLQALKDLADVNLMVANGVDVARKRLMNANNAHLGIDDFKTGAEHFAKMYFNPSDPLYCFKSGKVCMMAAPIVLSGGQWSVIKAEQLVSTYATRTAEALHMLDDAARFGAKIIDEAGITLIKESDEVGALVIATQQRGASEIIITGEQDLKAIINEGDLHEIVPATPLRGANGELLETPGVKGAWNKRMNKVILPKNESIKIGDHVYHINNDGIVDRVTFGNLTKYTRERNFYQQTYRCKKVKDGISGDDGGHLLGMQFNAAGEQINLVPMKSGINRAGGSYYQMESEWANALSNGGTVTNGEIRILYGANKRPIGFEVTADVNGVPQQWLHTN